MHSSLDRCMHAQGMESICVRAFAEALEVVPYTLAENAGLNPIQVCAVHVQRTPVLRWWKLVCVAPMPWRVYYHDLLVLSLRKAEGLKVLQRTTKLGLQCGD